MMAAEACLRGSNRYLALNTRSTLLQFLQQIQTTTTNDLVRANIGHHIHVAHNLYIDRLVRNYGSDYRNHWYLSRCMRLDTWKRFPASSSRISRIEDPCSFHVSFPLPRCLVLCSIKQSCVVIFLLGDNYSMFFFLIDIQRPGSNKKLIQSNYYESFLGGLSFVLAIVVLGKFCGVLELDQMIAMGMMGISVVLPAALSCFRRYNVLAQMPFNSWLLGAMVAQHPHLHYHSSTMVKAGVS